MSMFKGDICLMCRDLMSRGEAALTLLCAGSAEQSVTPPAAPGRGRFGYSVNTKWASPSCTLNSYPLMRGRRSPLVSRSQLSPLDQTGWERGQQFVCRRSRHWLAAPSCLCAGSFSSATAKLAQSTRLSVAPNSVRFPLNAANTLNW